MISNKELGYYTVDGKEFSSKIQACIYATQNNKQVEWHFNDKEFGSYNWTIEPTQTLTELYNKRARELREKYDYLAISYSGGSDSHNVLMSFIRQGLHVDELLINTFEKANTISVDDLNVKASWNYGAEYKLQIYPRLQEIKNLIPKTKITVCDLSDYVLNYFKNADESWVLNQKEVINPSGITRYNYLHFSETRKQFDKGYQFGIVVGVEKPITFIKDNKFYIAFTDRSANIVPMANHFNEYSNTNIEFFYWSPSCAELIAKQAHIVRKELLLRPQIREFWTYTNQQKFVKDSVMINKLIKSMIYSDTWNDTWFQTDKGIKFFYDEIDTWWHVLYKGTQEYKVWERGVETVRKLASPFIFDSEDKNLQIFYKMYYVGEISENFNYGR